MSHQHTPKHRRTEDYFVPLKSHSEGTLDALRLHTSTSPPDGSPSLNYAINRVSNLHLDETESPITTSTTFTTTTTTTTTSNSLPSAAASTTSSSTLTTVTSASSSVPIPQPPPSTFSSVSPTTGCLHSASSPSSLYSFPLPTPTPPSPSSSTESTSVLFALEPQDTSWRRSSVGAQRKSPQRRIKPKLRRKLSLPPPVPGLSLPPPAEDSFSAPATQRSDSDSDESETFEEELGVRTSKSCNDLNAIGARAFAEVDEEEEEEERYHRWRIAVPSTQSPMYSPSKSQSPLSTSTMSPTDSSFLSVGSRTITTQKQDIMDTILCSPKKDEQRTRRNSLTESTGALERSAYKHSRVRGTSTAQLLRRSISSSLGLGIFSASTSSLPSTDIQELLLPSVPDKDTCAVSAATLVQVLEGSFADRFDKVVVVDCRSEDEFNGGHIKGAINVVTPEKLERMLFDIEGKPLLSSRTAIIIHCEFSSVRGPRCWRAIRERDRAINIDRYPRLHYPQLYVLQNGYKQFFEQYKPLCDPQEYLTMKDAFNQESKGRGLKRSVTTLF